MVHRRFNAVFRRAVDANRLVDIGHSPATGHWRFTTVKKLELSLRGTALQSRLRLRSKQETEVLLRETTLLTHGRLWTAQESRPTTAPK